MSNEMEQKDYWGEEIPNIPVANEPRMACLFLLDTSTSMEDTIKELIKGLKQFKEQVCEDEKTRRVLDVAIVEFNTNVNTVQDFRPVTEMEDVSLTPCGCTEMVDGLKTAIDMVIERGRMYRRSGTQPYCPWIIMITDGKPTVDISEIAKKVDELDKDDFLRLWALAVEGADLEKLMKLCNEKRVLKLHGYDFTGFFDWVNKSMRAVSESVPGEKPKGQQLPDNVGIVVPDNLM